MVHARPACGTYPRLEVGLAVGLLSPVASYGFTTLVFGSAMPNLQRLPYMQRIYRTADFDSGQYARAVFAGNSCTRYSNSYFRNYNT